jgi:outer membrane protein
MVMKKYGYFGVAALILALVFCAFPAAASDKTGFVDIRSVMVNSAFGKKASEELKKTYEKSRATIQVKENELKKIKEELEKQKPLLKADVLQNKEKDYQKKLRDYQLLVKDSNDDLQTKEQEMQKKILPEILKAIRLIGEKEKYTLIIDYSQIPLPYFSKERDITKHVMEDVDKNYPPKKQ